MTTLDFIQHQFIETLASRQLNTTHIISAILCKYSNKTNSIELYSIEYTNVESIIFIWSNFGYHLMDLIYLMSKNKNGNASIGCYL